MMTLGASTWWQNIFWGSGINCKGIDCLRNAACLNQTSSDATRDTCRCNAIRRDLDQIISATSLDSAARARRLDYLATLVGQFDETKTSTGTIQSNSVPDAWWQCWPDSGPALMSFKVDGAEYTKWIFDIRLTALNGMLSDAKYVPQRALDTYIGVLQTSVNPTLVATALNNLQNLVRETPRDSVIRLDSERLQVAASVVKGISASPRSYTNDVASLAYYVEKEIRAFQAGEPPGPLPPQLQPKTKFKPISVVGMLAVGALVGFGAYKLVSKKR